VLAAQMPRRFIVVPLVIADHSPQRRWRIVPASPTANTSSLDTANTPWSSVALAIGAVSTHHWPDGQCVAVAQLLSGPGPSSPVIASSPWLPGECPQPAIIARTSQRTT
jgi:hypothetical protein